MKAEELQIGDWAILVNPDGHKCIPQKVTVDGLMLVISKEEGNYQYNPIPLTEDILKVNGFTQYGHHHILYVNENNPDEASIHIDYKESVDIDAPSYRYSGWCETVHELQHALRLCGLNKLADNFKIK